MAKAEKLFSKIVVVLFLLMIIIGFTVPGFLNSPSNDRAVQQAEQRICKSDPDCYLICDDNPVSVLCSQNLCSQNACDEYNLYSYQINPLTFSLNIEINGEKLNLTERIDDDNFFVTFDNQEVKVFSSSLTLNHILDKVSIVFNSNCLLIDNIIYCDQESSNLQLMINGEQSSSQTGFYIPEEGDNIALIFSN